MNPHKTYTICHHPARGWCLFADYPPESEVDAVMALFHELRALSGDRLVAVCYTSNGTENHLDTYSLLTDEELAVLDGKMCQIGDKMHEIFGVWSRAQIDSTNGMKP